jgi:hypothetical protein
VDVIDLLCAAAACGAFLLLRLFWLGLCSLAELIGDVPCDK